MPHAQVNSQEDLQADVKRAEIEIKVAEEIFAEQNAAETGMASGNKHRAQHVAFPDASPPPSPKASI